MYITDVDDNLIRLDRFDGIIINGRGSLHWLELARDATPQPYERTVEALDAVRLCEFDSSDDCYAMLDLIAEQIEDNRRVIRICELMDTLMRKAKRAA